MEVVIIMLTILILSLVAQFIFKRGRPGKQRHTFLVGYPPDLFPSQELTQSGPLADLAAAQGRLVSVYQNLPVQSTLTIWLRTFLIELRDMMDTAYRVMVITQTYGYPAQVECLVVAVQQMEYRIAFLATQRLLAHDASVQHERLNEQLATVRLCLRALSASTGGYGERGLATLTGNPRFPTSGP